MTKINAYEWWNVHRALQVNHDQQSDSLIWSKPFAEDVSIRDAEYCFSKAFSELAFVPGCSILSIDDDQFRLRSTLIEEMGFPRLNNPKNIFGPMSTGVVSLDMGVVLACRLSGRGESALETLQVVLQRVVGVDLPTKIRLSGSTVAIDRGYMGPEVIKFLVEDADANIIGTHKRIASFPFTFGDVSARRNQVHVVDKGAKSLYCATKKIGQKELTAFAYRGGRGNVATVITNLSRVAPNHWILVKKAGLRVLIDGVGNDLADRPLVTHLQQNTVEMTYPQGGIEWNLMRNGLVTSTVAYSCLKLCQGAISVHLKYVLDIVGIDNVDMYAEVPSENELQSMLIPRLKAILKARRQPVNGSKDSLIARILQMDPQPIGPTADIVKKWWMKPLTKSSMKVGSANEDKILAALPLFVREHTSNLLNCWEIRDMVERGLVRSRNPAFSLLATSNDAIVEFRSVAHPHPILAAVELKTNPSNQL